MYEKSGLIRHCHLQACSGHGALHNALAMEGRPRGAVSAIQTLLSNVSLANGQSQHSLGQTECRPRYSKD